MAARQEQGCRDDTVPKFVDGAIWSTAEGQEMGIPVSAGIRMKVGKNGSQHESK